MSQLLARIMLVIFMLPLGLVVYLTGIACAMHFSRAGFSEFPAAFVFAGALTWLFIAIYWILLWRSLVRWNRRRRGLTFLWIAVALAGAALLAMAIETEDRDLAYLVATIAAPSLWLIGTTLTWRETAVERGQRLRLAGKGAVLCPTCGYNLTGLLTARCPECGTQYTLDELMAAQPGADMAELGS